MYYRGGYMDGADPRELGLKRQRLLDQGSTYYGTGSGSNYMYSPPAYSYVSQPPPFPVVRLRGLPFDCSESDVYEFFHGLDVVDVLLVHKNGKFSGEAYCVLGFPLQVDFALQRNRQNIGRRYVEVFRSKRQEYYKAIANEVSDARGGSPHGMPRSSRAKSHDEGKESAEHTGVLRLRGLPFSAGKDEILDFFRNFDIREDSIHITVNSEGRPTGEAFVEFSSAENSKAAMVNDRKTLGSRYIELFPSSMEECQEAVSRGRSSASHDGGDDSPEQTTVVRMRGLPFSAGKDDIMEFFKEYVLSEDSIHITSNMDGRPTGEAFVEFADLDDAKGALSKDRMTLGRRYIELFPSSLEDMKESGSRGR
ncbi:uncharacterized protein LOC141684228 isoform X1 [Apium graveolens]|uniref:uncharacterized protein LOC141684228 isoform X1 n=2 Tax=Apium graveolens TaxID=4045 RepID=UPI003D78C3DC